MKVVRTVRVIWLIACVLALAIAQVAFNGAPTSEVAGSLTSFVLVICLPSSIVAYPFMFGVIDLFSSNAMYPYNSRIALTGVWARYVLFGLIQWYAIPSFIARVRSRREIHSANTT
jgi:hypothetical protein